MSLHGSTPPELTTDRRRRVAHAGHVVLLAAVYVVVARLGLKLDAVAGFATLVWPPSGIALATLLLGGSRLWPGVAIGAFAVNAWTGAPLLAACGIAAGNTLEAVLGAYALRRIGFRGSFDRIPEVLWLVSAAGLLATAASATVGTTSLLLAGIITSDGLSRAWRAWWLGDMAGVLVVAPFLAAWWRPPWLPRDRRRAAEGACLALAMVGVWALVSYGVATDETTPRQGYLLYPFLVWAALRFEARGVAAATLLACALVVAGTAAGRGPFAVGDLHTSLLHAQVYLVVAAITALLLAAAIAERREIQADLVVSRDLLRREAEEKARLYEEARQAIRLRDEFLSVASHELRTPLSSLVLQLAVLRRNLSAALANSSDSRLSRQVEAAARATDRLAKLVDGLLDVSRVATGRLELALEDCDLAEIARDVVERTADHAREVGCDLSLSVDGPATGRWDRLRLEQVVANLLSNALKYGGGKPIAVHVAATDERARLSVRDHGIGLSDGDAERIFERFERAAPPSHYGGLGLGLYITRQIVGEHGGVVTAARAPSAGAVFTIELPRRPVTA
jgi:signal transduction histidine kinase